MNKHRFSLVYLQLLLLFHLTFFLSCTKEEMPRPLIIALSRGVPVEWYINYEKWLKSVDSTTICLDMYHLPFDSAIVLFRSCDGLLLTGGTDVNPALYGKEYDTVRCWPIDYKLDSLEIALIDAAIAWKMPILGICRGNQMLNVALGGSLVVDIPEDVGDSVIHQCEDFTKCFHQVSVKEGSLLNKIANVTTGLVTSGHHQAVDDLAPVLEAIAFSDEGLIEAVQWKELNDKSFLLGVQWHPERMVKSEPLSYPIANRFLLESRLFQQK